ncbi:MAG: O-methyltransferase [Lachnospiraceae bacterium]|nr:O-methyltransferase [Lachnospiraceae bacterium]
MIVDERTVCYLNSLDDGGSAICRQIAKEARADFVPIIRKETAAFLRTMVAMQRPKRILEVGTAVGYSAIMMAEAMPEDGHITTIEKYEKRIPLAKENFKRAGVEEKITLLEGDALEILKTLDEPYDMIFMDAAKGQYIHFFADVMRLLKVGGVLISDNVLQDGDMIESRYAVTRRNRTIHARMREYLYELKHNEALSTSIIPLGDGVTLSTKIKETKE